MSVTIISVHTTSEEVFVKRKNFAATFYAIPGFC